MRGAQVEHGGYDSLSRAEMGLLGGAGIVLALPAVEDGGLPGFERFEHVVGPTLVGGAQVILFHGVLIEAIEFDGDLVAFLDAVEFPWPVGPGGVALISVAFELGELVGIF